MNFCAGCKISPEGYGQLTHLLTSLAQGRVAVLLEGGYNLESISHSMVMCAKALLGDPLPSPQTDSLNPAALTAIQRVVHHQRKHWSSLRFHIDLPDDEDVLRLLHQKEREEATAAPESWEERFQQLSLDSGPACSAVPSAESAPSDQVDGASGKSTDPAEEMDQACGGDATEPKTLQEFLLLPENVQVSLAWIAAYYLNQMIHLVVSGYERRNALQRHSEDFLPSLGRARET